MNSGAGHPETIRQRGEPLIEERTREFMGIRGTLSEEALAEFTGFFLTVCSDQVTFMEGLMQPDRLRTRILLWTEEEIRMGQLPAKSGSILEAVLYLVRSGFVTGQVLVVDGGRSIPT